MWLNQLLRTGVVFAEQMPFSLEQDTFFSEQHSFEQVPCQAQVSQIFWSSDVSLSLVSRTGNVCFGPRV